MTKHYWQGAPPGFSTVRRSSLRSPAPTTATTRAFTRKRPLWSTASLPITASWMGTSVRLSTSWNCWQSEAAIGWRSRTCSPVAAGSTLSARTDPKKLRDARWRPWGQDDRTPCLPVWAAVRWILLDSKSTRLGVRGNFPGPAATGAQLWSPAHGVAAHPATGLAGRQGRKGR